MQFPYLLPVLSQQQSARTSAGIGEFSSHFVDNFGRPITYLRVAVTDRCNLRCTYCMPETMRFAPNNELLTDDEIMRFVEIAAALGIRKVRITGGEPFARRGIVELMRAIKQTGGIEELHITTNGVLTEQYVPELVRMGVASVNVSLDTLNAERFHAITRRREFGAVQASLHALLQTPIRVNVNVVVMDGVNTDDIVEMAELARENRLTVRFIEEMPFNGLGGNNQQQFLVWTHERIEARLREAFPSLERVATAAHSTATLFHVEGFQGKLGIIAGFSRTFCGDCNRIRLTAKGVLKTCLYDNGALDVRQLLRSDASDDALRGALVNCIAHRFRDGLEAEAATHEGVIGFESMSAIGG
jgi:molybdenum cofactor biosynthesis protein A